MCMRPGRLFESLRESVSRGGLPKKVGAKTVLRC